MSSSIRAIDHNVKTSHASKPSSDKMKKRSKKTKPVLSYPVMPPSPDDWVLIPENFRRGNHSAKKGVRSHNNGSEQQSTKPKMEHSLSNAIDHIAATKKAANSNNNTGYQHEIRPERTARYYDDAAARRQAKVPPPAPSPPSLDTPALSDIEEDNCWSCCRPSASSDKTDSGVR